MAEHQFHGRTLARSQALQLLFQAEATGRSVEDVLNDDFALSQGPLEDYARELALGADGMKDVLDEIIAESSRNWAIGRMPATDRNLLRIALFEMLREDDVAVAVTIDETVELAKYFGTDRSSKFVNGLLGHVASELEAGTDVEGEAAKRAEQTRAERERLAEEMAADDAADSGDESYEGYGYDDYDDGYEDYAYDSPSYYGGDDEDSYRDGEK